MKVKTILGRIYYIIVAVCVFLHVVILSLSFLTTNIRKNIAAALFRTGNTRQMRITAGLYFCTEDKGWRGLSAFLYGAYGSQCVR